MKAYVYVLKDDNGKFYIGSCIDMDRRLKQHKMKHTATTMRMKNPKLVLSQMYNSLQEARFVERKIKKLKRKDYIEKMVIDGYIKMKSSPRSSMDRTAPS